MKIKAVKNITNNLMPLGLVGWLNIFDGTKYFQHFVICEKNFSYNHSPHFAFRIGDYCYSDLMVE